MSAPRVAALVVDDSATSRALLVALLSADPEVEVVGEATTGEEAVAAVERLAPSVVVMDVHMPVLDGFEACSRIMASRPTPIVIVTSSMDARDFRIGGQPVSRLTAVKDVFKDFVLGGEGLQGRTDDFIGMTTFAAYADSQCPLTLDHAFLIETLEQVAIVSPEEGRHEDGTAIGDAIALAVERLRDLERPREVTEANRIKSRIMILLTDGENNRGDISPVQAAELAQAFDIKIYTIGAGTKGVAMMPQQQFGLTRLVPVRVSIDEETLKRIADITGGRYFRATDTNSLREIYAEIDSLEKTETEQKRYMRYAELATQSAHWAGWKMPPLLPVVLALLGMEIVLVNTSFRKIP